MPLEKIVYNKLNARQKENYNFHKISAVLADYGYSCIRLSDDWQGADFIAQHVDGEKFLKVQLKSRVGIARKYLNRGLYICFPHKGEWYLYLHDEVVEYLLKNTNIGNTTSWKKKNGSYTLNSISKAHLKYLSKHKL